MADLKFLHFSSLQQISGLRHALTTRAGGTSEGAHSSLNLGYHVGDDAARVTENRRRLAEALGYDGSTLVAAQQVHGAQVHIVEPQDRGRGAFGWDDALPDNDALVQAHSQTPVLILVADCAPLLLVDPEHGVLAVVHAGWRGAVAGVTSATLNCMAQYFQTDAREVWVGIGPCLCSDCFEIGPEVAAEVAPVAPQAVLRGVSKPHLDLRAVLQSDLQRAGVAPEHIEALPDCPRCQPERFFSHRGQAGTAGRFGLVAWWE
ncbi:MAG TPA: peptidoglycan editing factor PgeF [Abditibacteriaceae bacterium]|nr:peptidoglycan editing factor PgeF [Abditibacteriaceae bacterium]